MVSEKNITCGKKSYLAFYSMIGAVVEQPPLPSPPFIRKGPLRQLSRSIRARFARLKGCNYKTKHKGGLEGVGRVGLFNTGADINKYRVLVFGIFVPFAVFPA